MSAYVYIPVRVVEGEMAPATQASARHRARPRRRSRPALGSVALLFASRMPVGGSARRGGVVLGGQASASGWLTRARERVAG